MWAQLPELLTAHVTSDDFAQVSSVRALRRERDERQSMLFCLCHIFLASGPCTRRASPPDAALRHCSTSLAHGAHRQQAPHPHRPPEDDPARVVSRHLAAASRGDVTVHGPAWISVSAHVQALKLLALFGRSAWTEEGSSEHAEQQQVDDCAMSTRCIYVFMHLRSHVLLFIWVLTGSRSSRLVRGSSRFRSLHHLCGSC